MFQDNEKVVEGPTKMVILPLTTTVFQDNEKVVEGPTKMVILPPNYYCVVKNPSIKDAEGKPCQDQYGQVSPL